MVTTICGLGFVCAAVGGVAGRMGLINVDERFTVMGRDIHVEFNRKNPIRFDFD